MTPERLERLRQRARRLAADLQWLADEFSYFAENATEVTTAREMMKWAPLRVGTLLTDLKSAKKQCSKLGPLSLAATKAADDGGPTRNNGVSTDATQPGMCQRDVRRGTFSRR